MMRRVLVANRGEIALRLLRGAQDLGLEAVAVHAADEPDPPQSRFAQSAATLPGSGPAAYLDAQALVSAAVAQGCDAVHPGYGFLSESAGFARACADAGLVFVGPTPAQLAQFGDKARARALARSLGVPLLPGGVEAATLTQAQDFLAEQGGAGIVVKAVAGGGGRGMRVVREAGELPQAWSRCEAEALAAFGDASLYVERLLPRARRVEVQVLGDGQDVIALGERECTLQRRFQKLVELAPSPALEPAVRAALTEAALRMARTVGLRSLATFEFLVDATPGSALPWVFIEANPRLQVEHTVTEAVLGLDLMQLQLRVAAGARLAELGLDPAAPPQPRGQAIQWRLNAESLDLHGLARPAEGRLSAWAPPGGLGIRLDTHVQAGSAAMPQFDTLLAKLVVHAPGGLDEALRRSRRALAEWRIEGLATNLGLLRVLAEDGALQDRGLHTRWLEEHLPGLLAKAQALVPAAAAPEPDLPLPEALPEGQLALRAPLPGRLVELSAAPGAVVAAGATIAVLEAMKMQHAVAAPVACRVLALQVEPGQQLAEGAVLALLAPVDGAAARTQQAQAADPDAIRPDLQRVLDRHAFTLDAARPEAVARRHAQGGRTARENIADLVDPGSFSEYGALAVAAQTRRRSLEDLIANTPADGMVTGTATVNAAAFGAERARCVVMAYDYTVLAGTQGLRNHQKTDRMLGLAHKLKLPVVLFAEGGGGRPGDVDMPIVAGLNNHTFSQFAALSGQVPVVGIAHGRCFAGNAALLGCADVVIATRGSSIGMSGPAMVEGGGLGRFPPESIGPSGVQWRNGVIDILVDDEVQAVAQARRYLGYFQGPLPAWEAPDQRLLRQAVPENRLRVYEVRRVLGGLFDTGSVLELRAGFGAGMVTALARIGGRPVGVLANDPRHLGGAIDPEAADKAARFMQLCNAHGLPIVSLVDTPGFMVGPDIEAQAQVRHTSRMFVVAAHLSVPFLAVVLRKGYGLGAQAMTAGGFDAPVFTVAWPTGEFGAMGLEGAVKLGFRKELEAAPEGPEREALYQRLVQRQYEAGAAMSMAQTLEIDAVIDPAETRAWLLRGLEAAGTPVRGSGRFVDTW